MDGSTSIAADLDLRTLSARESEQVEWKENVADPDDVAATLSAFANDWANLGGGYVVCGAKEERDEYGFPRLNVVGLTANRLREVEGRVLTACRDRVSPAIVPLVHELPSDSPDRRVLVFVMPATKTAHLFRRRDQAGVYYVRISRETREARNGVLRELFVRKGEVEEWDRRPCRTATVDDLDLLYLRDALVRMRLFREERGIDIFLSEQNSINPLIPSLCVREPLTGQLRPRNYAMLLFGRLPSQHLPGAYALFSVYPGTDRSEPHAERHEVAGALLEQARRLTELLDVQSYTAFDKTDPRFPNAVKYPTRALHEAMVNVLAHRDYEINEPSRFTVFADRIEMMSPGSLPGTVTLDDLRQGRAIAKWRNQSLAWFLNRLQLAQAEGQGIPTILRSMREEGCPPPIFEANSTRVVCTLPGHPRHALAREHRGIEEAISLGNFEKAQLSIAALLAQDPLNSRTLQLFAEAQRALGDPEPVREFVVRHEGHLVGLPPAVLTLLADALAFSDQSTEDGLALARRLYRDAAKHRMNEREVRRIALGLSKADDDDGAVRLLDRTFDEYPEFRENPSLLRIRGNAFVGLAKRCSQTGRNRTLPVETRSRAWVDCQRFLDQAERDLSRAFALTSEPAVRDGVRKNLDFVDYLRQVVADQAGR